MYTQAQIIDYLFKKFSKEIPTMHIHSTENKDIYHGVFEDIQDNDGSHCKVLINLIRRTANEKACRC